MPPAGSAGDPKAGRAEESPPTEAAAALLEAGRRSYAAGAWRDAYASLTEADSASPLAAADLELLATSASMLGRQGEWTSIVERAHHSYLDSGNTLRAVRCAFWIGVRLARAGEIGRATGWLARAQRLLEREEDRKSVV